MTVRGFARAALATWAAALLLLAPWGLQADEAGKTIKIGVVYDLTGPFAGGGSDLQYLGAKIMIDWFNQHGGIDGYRVEPIYADAQSKPDVAINEAVRLIEQEKVDMLLGFYSSAECVPAAARVEQFKKFMWITTCIASPVLEGRNLQYVFRPQPYGRQWGLTSTEMVAAYSKAQLGKDPKGLKVAIIHEDGPYGTDVAKGTAEGAAEAGFQVVVNEGYSASAPDLSSLVAKLKRGQPDVIFHTGYNPDITLFLRPARELGLKFSTLIGHGAGYGVYPKLKDCRQRRQLFLQRRPDLDLADQPQVAQARIVADHQGGRRRVCEGKARYGHQIGACRHGRIQHLRVSGHLAAGDQEIRRCHLRQFAPGRTRHRFAGRLDNARLRHQVRASGCRNGRPERARLSCRRAIYRRPELRRVAKSAAAARTGTETPWQLALCNEVTAPPCSRLPGSSNGSAASLRSTMSLSRWVRARSLG